MSHTQQPTPRHATRLMAAALAAAPATSTLNDQVTALFAAQPVSGDNPVGKAARSALVGRLQGATPGQHSEPWWSPSGETFLKLFFPNYAPNQYQGSVTPATGFGDSWWSDFAVVVLCQAMYNITSNLRPQLKQPNINNAVSSTNASLQPKLNALYLQLLKSSPNPVATALAAIPSTQWSQAATIYSGYLNNPAWISAKVAQAASHQWTDQVWELFHHWLKLQALGMSASAIDALINQLVAAQLPVPASVSAGRWETYLPWMSPLSLDWNDVKGPATSGILATVCMSTMGGVSCMNEENSFEFTANSQPGSKWRSPPGGSCFLAGTKVLMSDGSLKNIEQVAAGDQVRTRAGAAAVLATPTLVLQNEEVYGFNGQGLRFTGTHPFLTTNATSGQGAQLACAQPVDLMNTVPTLSKLGLAALGPSSPPLLGWAQGAARSVPVTSLQTYPLSGDTTIYDLVVDFDSQGLSEYIAGDGTNMFVVSGEVPLYGVAPLASQALSALMSGSWPTVQQTLQSVPADQWAEVLYQGLYIVSTSLVPDAIRSIQGNDAPPPPQPGAAQPAALREMARGMARAMTASGGSGTPTYDSQQGAYFAALTAIFGDELNDAINLGWRSFTPIGDLDATMLAVSALSLELLATDAIPSGEQLTLGIQLGRGAAAVARALPPFGPLQSAGYAQQFDQVVYFDNWRPSVTGTGTDTWAITFTLRRQDGTALPVQGVTALSDTIGGGYRLFSAAVVGTDGSIVGQMQFDVRPLVPQLMAAEMQAQSAWTQDKASAFARSLGATAGALMAQQFPAAVQHYLPPTSTAG